MLGWTFHVSNQEVGVIAGWSGQAFDDQWLIDAVAAGNAKQVGFGGGYPNIYSVKVSAIPEDKISTAMSLLQPEEWVVVEVWDQS